MSSAQFRLWFLDQIDQIDQAVGDAYHLSGALDFSGRLDEEALGRALDALLARHDVLRATFTQVDGEPVQRIPDVLSLTLRVADLRALPHEAREAERQRQIAEECSARFDLQVGPLIRGRLLRLAPDRNTLVLTLHHMVSDGWSTAVLMRDVAALYAAFAEGRPDPLVPLTVQYADHVAEEKARAVSTTRQMRLDHWTRHLAGAPELLTLPADRPRPPVQSHAGDRVDMVLPAPLLDALRAWAKGRDATLAMALHAGLTVLLARLSGQDDIVIGTPVANRRRPAYRPLMGFFVNTLALRVQLGDDPTAAALLDRVRGVAQAGYLRQDVPFEQLVEALQPARDKSHSPIFQVMLVMQNFDTEVIALPGATLQLTEVPTQAVPFDLSVLLRESADGMVGRFAYSTALYDRATVERWTRYFVRVLEAMVRDDQQRVGDIVLVDADERALLLDGFNATRTDSVPEALVHTMFEARAARTPEAIALVDGERNWRYDELDHASSRLAHRLRAQGVGPDARVALFVTRGAEMVVGLLAVLKAGGAYVPLDPADPPERIARMLEDAAPVVVLTLAQLKAGLPAPDVPLPVLLLDAEPDAPPAWPHTPIDPATIALRPEHLAYVIYTSGSTGMPKGVAMPHSALVNLIRWQAAQRAGATALRTLQYVALGFDVAFQEIFTTLCGGGTLVLVSEGTRRDMAALWRLLGAQRVERLVMPFTSLKHLADAAALSPDVLPPLREVVTGGEQLHVDGAVRALFVRLADCRLQNQYGPTEYPVATALDLHGAPDPWPAQPSIGRPIDNTRVRILDSRLQPVPIGVKGDIHLAGAGMARGYLNRPELSATAFVPDPFDARPGSLLYRTGDVGRWRSDGSIDFLGRADEQIKLRGFRIEPGEVESQLGKLSQVGDAAVMLREDSPGDKRLVAYVAPAPGVAEDGFAQMLRTHLRAVLPEYMVPGAFVVLPALPLTVNGKVDRRALPPPLGEDTAERVMPRNGTEQTLWTIWSEVLRSTAFGVEDSFFDLGGHSLLTTQVAARVRERLAVELPLADLFAHVSIAELARHVGGLAQAGAAASQSALAVALERVDRARPQALTPAQQRLWFLARMGNVGASYNMPAAWRLRGALDRPALLQALSALVDRHEMLRTTFAEIDGAVLQRTATHADFALREFMLDASASPAQREADIRRRVDEEADAPFDLATGPLIRGALVQVAPDDHVLMLTMHHVISDGWTIGVLMREINSLYAAFSEGRAGPLAEGEAGKFDYLDYADWQNRWLAQPAVQAQLDDWKHRLEGAPELLELPTDRPRPLVQSHAGSAVRFELDAGLRAAVKSLARAHGVTLYMVLHAGFSVLLARLSGQRDLVIGTPVANRPRVEFEGMAGFFVNTLAVRTDLGGHPTVAELLQRIKRTTLEAYAQQDAPFEQVVEAVRPSRSLAHSPIFQALLTLQETPDDARLALPGLAVQALPLQRHGAPFDLSLMLEERSDGSFGVLEYASDLFDHTTAQRWVGHFLNVLAEMVRDATQTVEALPLLDAAGRALVLEGFNAGAAGPAPDGLVHDLFAAQAGRMPDAVAVMVGERRCSYAELDAASNRLAHRLREAGVAPDVRVALFVERSLEMVVALLAVLKAGGAYLPLDPADPPERIAHLLKDAAPSVVLTLARLKAELAVQGVPVIVLDAEPDTAVHWPDTPLEPSAIGLRPGHLAYVIYTSGSTGTPKGVAMPHSALVNLIRWQQGAQPEAGALRTLQYVALGFDVAFQEIFTTLCGGGTLVLPAEGTRRDMAALWRLLGQQRIERLILPFISLQHLAQEAAVSADPLPPLQQVVTGGEQVRIGAEIRSLFQRLGHCRLQNQYGPTEYPVATALDLDADPARWPVLPTIGRPIAHTRIHLLDALGQPVPIGVKGEVFVAGAGMARGYLHRPELSATAFVPDPFDARPGARHYKTGDVARWRADGSIEFLGREDDQIKLRGFRIEPAEIEARLASHPRVRDAAVLLREDRAGRPRLVAYVALSSPADGDPADIGRMLGTHVRAALPEHMVPAAFVVLPALPLTVSGKVDRRALPAPADAGLAVARRMPQDATEQTLWDIWSEVLDLRGFGIDDSFFELGGHSLMTTQVASRIRQRLAVELPLAELFEHPTIAALAPRVAQLARETAPQAALPIVRVPRGTPLPVSLSQRRMWVIQQFDPTSPAYNVAVPLRLRGALDVDVLQRAFDRLVERHEGLRTRFAMHGVEPAQFIAAALPQPIERVDLRGMPVGERLATARAMLRDRMATPFDLTQAPLQRVTLVRLDEDDHALLWLMHHAISDNWAMAILMREMLVLYAALSKGDTAELAPLALEYADYAAWQRSPTSVAQRRHQMAYWVDRLRGLGRLSLPTDFARPAHPGFRGAKVSATLPVRLREALQRFCGQHGVTPFLVLLAAFKLMLSRQAGSTDIAVGTPIANRHHLATEHLVGTLVNTLVMRTDLAGDPSFDTLVQRVRSTALEAFAHQDAPFDELVEALGQDRVAQPEGLVRVLFNVPNAPMGRREPVDFSVEEFDLERTAAQFDLSVHIDTEFSHRVHLEYATDLYAPVTAERMLDNYLALVMRVLEQPERPLSAFSMLAPAQLALLRDDWNGTACPLPPERLVHRHLRTVDATLRDRVAVVDASGRDLRYGELEARANALARALRARGIGRGHRVGLCVARDAGMLVAQLAVLKSGAAYVPLDPSFPVDRLTYMAGDAALSAILVPADLVAPFADVGVPLLDPGDPALTADASGDPLPPDTERDAQPLDAAYLIYTSGSTGRPKGVAVPHRAVVNFLATMARAPGLNERDRLVAVTTLSFDIAVLELMLPLSVGAQVIVASRDQVGDPARLRALLEQHAATVMQATPSAWRALLDTGWTGGPGFRALIGGEPLPAALAEPLMARCDALWNMYGPTETTVWSTCWQVRSPRDGISIGRPIANTSVWILDAAGHPCPIGVPGEACIGGLGVALGYHEREALTAERFVPDPWSDEPGARLYRTGDLVRWRHDGWLEHLGRIDHQVKVRGFRIELGEIESVLSDHPGIANCVVVTRAEREDDVRLVAYYEARTAGVDAAALRAHLRERLPDYMVPQHFMGMAALPQLPNGKIDRAALPAPAHEVLPGRSPAARQPLSAQEQAMADIWAELLGTTDIVRTDNFFDLGGHSLLAMRAVVAIQERLGWQVAPRRFVYETLGQLAREDNLPVDRANG